jgi:predicted ribosome quality control (RQC) complex YloA/Tae2 family protein
MNDVEAIFSGIDYKVRKLAEYNRVLRIESGKYSNEIQELKKQSIVQKEKIKELEEKIEFLQLAKTLENKEGNVESTVKINKLVREIEKCIGLLNT